MAGFWITEHPLPVHARAACGVIASFCGLFAVARISLAELYALVFLAPLFVTLLSGLVLKEPIGPWRWSAVIGGFAGALIVIRPGLQDVQLGHVAAVCCGLSTGTAILIMRGMGGPTKTTSVLAILMIYLLVASGIATGVTGLTLPSPRYFLTLAITGGFFGLGQWALINAIRIGPASKIAPLHYTQLVWGTAFVVLLFKEYPDGWTVMGLLVIAASGLLTALREAIRRPKLQQGIEAAPRTPS